MGLSALSSIVSVLLYGFLIAFAFDAKKISIPLHENKLTGLLFFVPVGFPMIHSDPVIVVSLALVWWVLLWATAIDLRERSVYDWHTGVVFGTALLLGAYHGDWGSVITGASIAAVFGFAMKLIGFILYGKNGEDIDYGFGDGDFLLIIALGCILGLQTIPFFFWTLLASFIISMFLMGLKKIAKNDPIPFVPFIGVGFIATVIINPNMQFLRNFFLLLMGR